MDGRRPLHAYMSDGAHDAWHTFAANNGVSVTGLLQAVAGQLAAEQKRAKLSPPMAATVAAARKIDAVRRRR